MSFYLEDLRKKMNTAQTELSNAHIICREMINYIHEIHPEIQQRILTNYNSMKYTFELARKTYLDAIDADKKAAALEAAQAIARKAASLKYHSELHPREFLSCSNGTFGLYVAIPRRDAPLWRS